MLAVLGKAFGDSVVKLGTEVIELAATEERMPVKVVAACGHKYFYTFPSKPASRFVEGIVFTDSTGKEIVNYPKQHLENGEAKQKLVSSFRPVVRVFKNLAAHLEQDGKLRPTPRRHISSRASSTTCRTRRSTPRSRARCRAC